VIVGVLTMALTVLAVHLHVGIPQSDETQIANLARAATGSGGLFAFFQLSSGLLLLSAAASSFQAGPGLLKAIARVHGMLPPALIILVARGQEQELVLVYAVAVFVSFLAGLLAMAHSRTASAHIGSPRRTSSAPRRSPSPCRQLARGYPLLALAGTALVAGGLYARCERATPQAVADGISADGLVRKSSATTAT